MHGVFARFYKIKVKSTGFGFLGPFLAAFVEPDEKEMERKSIKAQLSVISGGSFANLIMAVIFFLILNSFFAAAFVQAGVIIPQLNIEGKIVPSYMMETVNISELTYNNGDVILTDLVAENKTDYRLEGEHQGYYLTKEILSITPKNTTRLIVYVDSPAYNLKINGTIQEINGNKIKNYEEFKETMAKTSPEQEINLKTSEGDYNFELASDPKNSSRAVIGIGFPQDAKRSPLASTIQKFMTKRNLFTYYESIGPFSIFVYNLLLWIVLINVSVMLVNMLPFGIFDGGKFFYLTILGLTKSKKKAAKGFKIANMFILLVLITLMAVWLVRSF